jgi:hypothetical protein
MTENQPINLKKRDGALNFWLFLLLFANIIFVVSQVPGVNELFFPFGAILFFMFSAFSGVSSWSSFVPIFIAFAIVSICSVVALFVWRKWGYYTICLVAIASFLTSISVVGILTFGVIVNCVAVVILGILLRAQWNLFR